MHTGAQISTQGPTLGGGGGSRSVPGQSDKKSSDNVFFLFFFYFSPQLIFTEVKWSISKKSIIFQGSRGGSNIFQGGGGEGGPTFPGGGGVGKGPITYSL